MSDFQDYLKPGMRGHLIGVGGVSMAPLAEVLAGMGLVIDGSDMAESEKTQHLRSLGIEVKIGHSAMNVAPDIQFVVRTAAVRDDARKSGVASTVVDCTGEGPVVLREGALTQADVRALS